MNHNLEHILVIGPTGAGKTSQGRALAGMSNRPYADMSRILKISGKFHPEVANRALQYSANGLLVPDEIIMPEFDTYLSTHNHGTKMVFMGVPRISTQVEPFLESVERHIGFTHFVVADLDLSPETAIRRCKERAERAKAKGETPRHEDLDEKIIRKRLDDWMQEKQSLLNALDGNARLVRIECQEDPQATFLSLVKGVGMENELFIEPAPLKG
jgi:adenylate kinase